MSPKGSKGLVEGPVDSVDGLPLPDRTLSPMRRAVIHLNNRLKASKRYERESILRPLFKLFMQDDRVGGVEGFASFIAETHEMVKDNQSFPMRHRWAAYIHSFIKDFDQTTKDAIEMDMEPEELHLQMVGGLLEMIRQDPDFARAIILEAALAIFKGKGGATRLQVVIDAIEYIRDGGDISEEMTVSAGDQL